jgi:hypothetical protein
MSRFERFVAGALLLVCLVVFTALCVRQYSAARYRAGYDAAVAERAAADAVAVLRRTEENVVTAARQGDINLKITETKHEELAPVRERIVTQRVYVGSAICGPAAPAETEIPNGGDEAHSPGRLVRQDAERDIVALKLAVEEHLATARACQAAAREHGLVP